MRYIKTYKIFESNQIWDLEDICQEIKDEGFNVNIRGVEWGKAPSELGEAKVDISNGSRQGSGISGSNFTMVGILQLTDDGRILGTGCTCTPRYPGFTMLEINFAK